MSEVRTKSGTDVMNVPEVMARTGLSRNGTYKAIRRGDIPSKRIGRRIVVPRHAFEAWLAATSSRPSRSAA